ncbi:MAG: insulinase family protein [Acholeplasmataceae bacterium]|nr:insulinase family protein [Acholeplasmataceae bacterium]
MIIKTTKYKTNVVSLRFKEPLTKENLGLRAFLPNVMVSKSPLYNSRKVLNEALEDLYGATLSQRTFRQGLLSIVEFSITFINHKFTTEPLLENALKLLKDVVFGHKNLSKTEFLIEKKIAKDRILAFQNNKTSYALTRLFEVMFEGDNQSLISIGKLKDIENVSYNQMNNYYKKFIKSSYDVLISGDFKDSDIELINSYFKGTNEKKDIIDYVNKEPNYKEVIERDKINQAKVNIGYLLPVRYKDEEFYQAAIFNLVFGGDVHSRLFLNVREKHSLCYYVRSLYEPFKGFIYVVAGIDKGRVELALKVIDEELEGLKKNLISDDELLFSKQSYINSLKEAEDSQNRQLDSFYLQKELGLETTAEMIEKINAVTKEEVQQIARKVTKDALYILAPEEM